MTGRYTHWWLESPQSAECLCCDGRATADEPGDLDKLLALIEAHRCDLGPNRGKPSVVETCPRVGGERPVRASSDDETQPRDDPATPDGNQ